ncbi:MAG: lipopolysaccharide transport periplasmic protein LptA [Deltaproteobacteria bacterium]|nr:lipopolysaccharide transport periplasmic protein LptA [Deltaproteobacteria bacterium]
MRFFNFKFTSLVIIVLIFVISFSSFAAEKIYSTRKKINVKSDKLKIDNAKNYAEFVGNVIAQYDNIFISADKVGVFYNQVSLEEKVSEKGGVEKITAFGNVKIKTEKYTGYADNAEYIVKSETLILQGEVCKVIDNENSIEGGRIILDKKTGNITVEGDGNSRVETVFYSKE